jgi:hypothetical protein
VPSRTDHIAKAEGNAAFALSLSLNKQADIDWALVAFFYAAIHYVEAYLAPAIHLKSHETRDKYIGKEAHLRRIYKEYSNLKYFGYAARYEMCGFKAEDVNDEAAKDYETIKAHITAKL